jgi:hypothetical protein
MGAAHTRMWVFACSAPLPRVQMRAAARVIEELNLGWWTATHSRESPDTLRLPYTRASRYDTFYRGEASLLASTEWARQLAGLRVLRISHLSWGGAARLLSLLPAWPRLEVVELRFAYDCQLPEFHLRSLSNNATPFQDFSADLAAVLGLGMLPKLRFLWLGNLGRTHCLGQRLSARLTTEAAFDAMTTGARTPIELDDRGLLEKLGPTAALWWMAERASHVRVSTLHQWEYELDHGADVNATVDVATESTGEPHDASSTASSTEPPAGRVTHTLLTWMERRLAHQRHSRAGHRAVHRLLVQRGARATRPFRPIPRKGRGSGTGAGLGVGREDGEDDEEEEGGTTDEWTTDEEDLRDERRPT